MSSGNKKIMICDDSILARKNLITLLDSLGYSNIIEVSNGQDAIDSYKAERPDIVFLDIIMPVKDGVTATREIIEFDNTAKVVMVSSVGTQTNLREAIKAGAKDFIQKPIEEDLLKQIIEHILLQ